MLSKVLDFAVSVGMTILSLALLTSGSTGGVWLSGSFAALAVLDAVAATRKILGLPQE